MTYPQEGLDKGRSGFAVGLLKRFPRRPAVLLGLLFITFGAGIFFWILGNSWPQADLAESDHQQLERPLNQPKAQLEATPDLKSFAGRVQTVARRLAGEDLDPHLVMEKVGEREPIVRLDPAELKGLQEGLADFTQALADARPLADLPIDRPAPVRTQKGMPGYDADVLRVAWLLRLDAELLAQEGKIDEALQLIRAGLKAGRSIGDSPASEAQKARIDGWNLTAGSLERVLAQGEASDKALLAAQQLVEEEAAQELAADKLVAGKFKPSIEAVAKSFNRSLAELRCAAVGLAVERYRKKNHLWPKTLEELIPSFMARLPSTPRGGKPLRYYQFKDQAIIHTVGPGAQHLDEPIRDESIASVIRSGGSRRGAPTGRAQLALLGPEASFRLWDVPLRGQEPLKQDGQPELGLLLADYRAYGLPLPPKSAKLIRFNASEGVLGGGKPVINYTLGFLLPPEKDEEYPEVLHLTRILQSGSVEPVQLPDPRALVTGPVPAACLGGIKDRNEALVTAIQCKALGWDALAQSLLKEHYQQDSRHAFLKAALARYAWVDWERRLAQEPDWQAAAAAMHRILSADPSLNTVEHCSLLQSLEDALAPRRAKPGSIESMIDDLVDVSSWGETIKFEKDPKYLRVLRQGFAAVPTLLEHFDDNRLTRHSCERYGKWDFHRDRVGNIVSDLLKEMACGELVTAGEHEGWRGWPGSIDKVAARNWWQKVKDVGEETYMVAHALPAQKDAWSANTAAIEVLAAKYPKRLLEVYQTILDQRPSLQTWPLAPLVASSSLAQHEKEAMLLSAAGNKDLLHKRAAIEALRTLNRQAGIPVLIETLNRLPKTPQEPYHKCQEAWFAYVAQEYDDPRVWRALVAAAKRADPGLRMEMLTHFGGYRPPPDQQQRQLRALADFLDDATVRDIASNPAMYTLGFAGSAFPRLEVGNYAALKMARLLELTVGLPLNWREKDLKNWSPEQWARFREQVRQAAK